MEPKLPVEWPKVKILECHSIPDIVGKEAQIISYINPNFGGYPIQVMLVEPITMQFDTPMGMAQTKTQGPFPFRAEELELIVEAPPAPMPEFLQQSEKHDMAENAVSSMEEAISNLDDAASNIGESAQ